MSAASNPVTGTGVAPSKNSTVALTGYVLAGSPAITDGRDTNVQQQLVVVVRNLLGGEDCVVISADQRDLPIKGFCGLLSTADPADVVIPPSTVPGGVPT